MRKILFVDDDQALQKAIAAAFKGEFVLVFANHMVEAISLLDQHADFAAAVVDRRLPDGDGLALANEIRQRAMYETLPIIFLSGLTSESDRISGFFAGGDDYVTKPFSVLELKARISARIRALEGPRLTIGPLEINFESHRVFLIEADSKTEIELTRIEFKILAILAGARGAVIPRETLLVRIWGSDTHVSDRAVDSHISHLRTKLSPAGLALDAVRGEGYRLELEQPSKKIRPA